MLVALAIYSLVVEADAFAVNTTCTILTILRAFRRSNAAIRLILDRYLGLTVTPRELSSLVFFTFSYRCRTVVWIIALYTSRITSI